MHQPRTDRRHVQLSALVFAIAVSLTSAALPAKAAETVYVEPILPSTGLNSDCDTPLFEMPLPLPVDTHFDFIGLYDPNSPAEGPERDAIELAPSDCSDQLETAIATTSNPDFRAANGFPEPDSRLKNLRSDEVPVIALPDGTRQFLPADGAVPAPFPPTRSQPSEALTLGEFRDVSGEMTLRCREDGSSSVRIRASGYRPNSLLTVWAIWFATPPGAPEPGIVPLPFGGAPNVLPIDRNGQGVFFRELGYCPKENQPNGDQLMVIDLAEHWDGNVYGAAPDLPFVEATFQPDPSDPATFTSPIGAGIVTVNRGVINVTLEPSSARP